MLSQTVTRVRTRLSLSFVTLVCIVTMPLVGQDPDAPRLTVMTLRSQEQELGFKTADMLRDRLTNDISVRDLTVVSSDVISQNMKNADFSIQDTLTPEQEQQLAKLLLSDFFVTGTVDHTNNRYRLDARLVLSHDLSFAQPLPTATGNGMGDVVGTVVRSIQQALEQYPRYRTCMANLNKHPPNYAAAVAAARSGIRAYPRATWVRMCVTGVYLQKFTQATSHADSVTYVDSVLGASLALLRLDSLNRRALRLNAILFKASGDTARERETLLAMVRADPSNTPLANEVIITLQQEGRAAAAIPLVRNVLEQAPEDVPLRWSAFLVYLDANDWTDAVQSGRALVRLDTAAADTMYFLRMASAYRGLGQLPRAIDILTQGTTKYPTSVTLWRYTGQALSDAGQTEQALVALQRSISLVPNDVSILLQIATIYDRQNQPDSVYAVVARAATIPRTDSGNMELMAKLVLKVGTTVFTAATESKRRDDYQKAIEYLQLANTLAPSIDAQFLIGASSFNLMKSVATAANHSKSCALAQLAQRAANDAQANLSVGVKDQKYHDGAQQMLQRLHQFIPAINKQIKQLCH